MHGCMRIPEIVIRICNICPRLHGLSWNLGSDRKYGDAALEFHWLLSPIITSLTLHRHESNPVLLSLLPSISFPCPRITEMILLYGNNVKDLADAISKMITQWNQLQTFVGVTSFGISRVIIKYFAYLSPLKHLPVDCDVIHNWERLLKSLNKPIFLILEELELNLALGAFKFISSLISLMAPQTPLKYICISCDDIGDASNLGILPQVTNDYYSRWLLPKVDVSHIRRLWAPQPSFVIDEDTLRPLLDFINLTQLKFCTPHAFRISNSFVCTMAKAWPKLCCLSFNVHWG